MADNTVSIDVIDKSIPIKNHRNLAVINQPNPCYGYSANAMELAQLIQMPSYYIYEAGTNTVIDGNNYYDYFPEEGGGGGGGGEAVLINKTITSNDTYIAKNENADGYRRVSVNVPNSYTAGDEGKVVSGGSLIAQTSSYVNANSVVNTTTINSLTVDVANTYTNEDEGKVVNNGALISQTSTTVTKNSTVDTTLVNSVTVDVEGVATDDVRFYDYDGTILHSYSAEDFAQLSAMPENPTHEGLTAQGWNWTLVDAQDYVSKYNKLEIGQMYVTNDGKTRIYVTLVGERLSPVIKLHLAANSSIDIDWGDGSTHSEMSSTSASYQTSSHIYSTPGDYVITIEVLAGSFDISSGSGLNISVLFTNGNSVSASPDRAYLNSIKKVEIGSNCTGFGQYAFMYCHSLETITIPNTITSFGTRSFEYCTNLKHLTVPNNVDSLGDYAFSKLQKMRSVSLPKSLTSISQYVFQACTMLERLTIPNNTSLTSLSGSMCIGCVSLEDVVIPNNITTIGSYCFQNNRSLTVVTLPNALVSLNESAFRDCSSLKEIIIPNTVTSLGQYAFAGCSCLENVTLSNSLTSISQYTFSECASLLGVNIPENVTTINDYAFYACTALKRVSLPSTLKSIGAYGFSKCTSLNSLSLPNGLTSLGNYAFSECLSLSILEVPDSVTSIGQYAFYTCSSLVNVNLGSVTSISNYTNSTCSSLNSITIPATVSNIGTRAFTTCSYVNYIRFEGLTPPTIAATSFTNVPNTAIVYVPEDSYYEYMVNQYMPSPSQFRYVAYKTFTNGEELPTRTVDMSYSLTWYATIDDLIAGTNPITVGNGDEVYATGTALTRVNRYTSACATVTNSDVTTNTATVSTTIGDLVIASFVVSYAEGYSITEEGWTIIGECKNPVYGTITHVVIATKTATDTSETITVTTDYGSRLNINMIAITGASIDGVPEFDTSTGAGYSRTADKPKGLILWGVYSSYWVTSSGKLWSCSETREPYMTLIQTNTFPRLLSALDQSPDTTQTFTSQSNNSNNGWIWYTIKITGIPNFWHYE